MVELMSVKVCVIDFSLLLFRTEAVIILLAFGQLKVGLYEALTPILLYDAVCHFDGRT